MKSFLKKIAFFYATTLTVCTAYCMNQTVDDIMRALAATTAQETENIIAARTADLNQKLEELKKTYADEIQRISAKYTTTQQMKTKIETEKDSLAQDLTSAQKAIAHLEKTKSLLESQVTDEGNRITRIVQEKNQIAQEKNQITQKVVTLEKDIATIAASLTKWRTATGISACAVAATLAYILHSWFKFSASSNESSEPTPIFGSNDQEELSSNALAQQEQSDSTTLEEAIDGAIHAATDLIQEVAESLDEYNDGMQATDNKNNSFNQTKPTDTSDSICAA